MKIHRPLVEQSVLTILDIFTGGRPADKVLERILRGHRQWGARDRRFVAETVYEIVRHWRLLWHVSGGDPVRALDREGLTVEDVWRVWAVHHTRGGGELPEWPEVRGVREESLSEAPRAILQSIPDWLDEMGVERFGESWDSLVAALNKPADVFLRTNTLKTDRPGLIARLQDEGISAAAVEGSDTAVRLSERRNIFSSKTFHDGWFEVQDYSSQTVAPLLAPRPGERVADACAGGGGKTLHLAALMKNKGRLIAMDVHQWKLDELKNRARRAGVHVVEPKVIDSTKVIKRLEEGLDRLLLDVPCTGLGVLRRNPDAKWRLRPEELPRLMELQKTILRDYSRMVKPGGSMVYATCSFLPDENERQVQTFLESDEGQSWNLMSEASRRPDRDLGDGFFTALFQRKS